MSYQEVYKQKLTTADEAVKAVQSGDWVDYGWSVCSADALDKALARRMDQLTDVKIRGGILKMCIRDRTWAARARCGSARTGRSWTRRTRQLSPAPTRRRRRTTRQKRKTQRPETFSDDTGR